MSPGPLHFPGHVQRVVQVNSQADVMIRTAALFFNYNINSTSRYPGYSTCRVPGMCDTYQVWVKQVEKKSVPQRPPPPMLLADWSISRLLYVVHFDLGSYSMWWYIRWWYRLWWYYKQHVVCSRTDVLLYLVQELWYGARRGLLSKNNK